MGHKVLGGSYSRWEGDKATGKRVRYPKGSVINDLTPREVKTLGHGVAVVGVGVEPEREVVDGDTYKLSEMNVSEAKELISELEEAEEVAELISIEARGRARKGVLAAANARLDELREDDGKEDD